MAAIIRSVATLARDNAGPSTPVILEEALETAITLAWNDLKQRADLVRDYAHVPPVIAKSSDLTELFVHLLLNAAHSIESKNAIITVRTSADQHRASIHIVDSGQGMSPEQLSRAFEPFFTTKLVSCRYRSRPVGLPRHRRPLRRYDRTSSDGVGLGTTVIVRLPLA